MTKFYAFGLTVICVSFLCGCCLLQTSTQSQPVSSSFDGLERIPECASNKLVSVSELASEFRTLKNGHERMRFVVSLIDSGSIAKGTPISYIKAIFGDWYSESGIIKDGEGRGSLYLADTPKADGGGIATVMPIGWRMTIYYTEDGKISAYYMTNLWKFPGKSISERWKESMVDPCK